VAYSAKSRSSFAASRNILTCSTLKYRIVGFDIRGIRPEAYRLAIRMVGAKARRIMSLGQKAALEKARLASPLIAIRTVQDRSPVA
jgi:hypothetical protein